MHRISYPELRHALNRLSDTGTTRSKMHQKPPSIEQKGDIDEWILIHEKYLADDERLGDQWQSGLITLDDAQDVFPTSVLSCEHRKITRPNDLPGYKLLDNLRAATVEIQPSLAAFRDSFERLSDGLLKNLNWDNVLVAGGIVLGTLIAVDAAAGAPWKSSDIDVYIYDLGPKEANAKIQHIFSTFQANLPPNTPTFVVRNSKTITFYASYPLRRIQVVLKLVKSPRAVLLNFDLDICAMGWDGSDFWMLPRAARALETGYIVFTMNLIQGHYLSERRATQEQRVFKYAYKGYGIRILPSYVSSLPTPRPRSTKSLPPNNCSISTWMKIRESSRSWTQTTVARSDYDEKKFSHRELDSKYQVSSEPQGRSCLSSFCLFMRHVELWDMERRGEVSIEPDEWANTTYEDSVLAYDDNPSYKWGPDFKISSFKTQIDSFNLRIFEWLEQDDFLSKHGLEDNSTELDCAQRITYGSTAAEVLEKAGDIVLPVILPCDFAAFANDLIEQAHPSAAKTPILTPALESRKDLVVKPDSKNAKEGLFLWRIGNELMWQQLDRRIDELS
ncbi:hypothetical protein R3P38DRAFT_65092 [Favolaschia claudopus]|uniref:Uncharacterized protein n=1 Tax=Favolaschia claudopus TaxID=2862362 RepID=A0AAW0ELT0_9AGAR